MTRLITALDVADPADALALVERLEPKLTRLKVGNELFTAAGPELVETLQRRGFEVFLDLKYHDIPNTVAAAVARAAALGVWMVNVHAGGGRRMLGAARAAVPPCGGAQSGGTRLIGVTVLTSLAREDLADVGLDMEPAALVERLATLVRDAGLDGVVCSPREIALVRGLAMTGDPDGEGGQGDRGGRSGRGDMSAPFLSVTPGIRPRAAVDAGDVTAKTEGAAGAAGADTPSDDQRRTLTPREAILAGADHLVVGRPITRADDPLEALARIGAEIDAAIAERESGA